jgi:hypothetical protein
MPLQSSGAQSQFLRRKRVFVDAVRDQRNRSSDSTPYDAVIDVADQPARVLSAELSDYSVPQELAAAFLPAEGAEHPGSLDLDIRMSLGGDTLEWTCKLSPRRYFQAASEDAFLSWIRKELIRQLSDLKATGWYVLGSSVPPALPEFAYYDPMGGIDHFFTVERDQLFPSGRRGAVVIKAFRQEYYGGGSYGPIETVELEFLFASGPSASNNFLHEILGFDKEDVGGAATVAGESVFWPVPKRYLNLYPYRYVDFTLDEIPELRPLERVYLTTLYDYRRHTQNIARPRLLRGPSPRRLDRLTLRARLAGGRRPNLYCGRGYNLVIDFVLLAPETDVPEWVQTYLRY